MSLNHYFRTNTGRPINKWAKYLPVYERHFSQFQNRSIFFLEIGTGNGGSSQMFSVYFGPRAEIVTIDSRPECKVFENRQVKVRIGSQDDLGFLSSVVEEFGAPDIVLDDGSHQMDHVRASFHFLYPRMAREAIYMVEDMHTAYWPAYGGGLKKKDTFIEEAKDLIDELYSDNQHNEAMGAGPMPTSDIGKSVRGIFFYESMVVIEKGPVVDKGEDTIPYETGTSIW